MKEIRISFSALYYYDGFHNQRDDISQDIHKLNSELALYIKKNM